MFECYEFEECEYNGQPKCCLPDDVDCPHGVKKHKPTNADRIRAMSDEELAEWLCRALDCGFCKSYLQDMSIYSCCENQVKGIFDWLQSPTEEDT